METVDRGSGWSSADWLAFDAELGDVDARLDAVHARCAELGFPKERCHVRIVVEKDVLFFEDEEGRVGQSFFALPTSSAWGEEVRAMDTGEGGAWRGMLYSEGEPGRRWPSMRWHDARLCPWLWYTP